MEKTSERNKKNNITNRLLVLINIGVAGIYFILLFKIVFFKYVGIGEILSGKFNSEFRSVNLIPFQDFLYMFSSNGILGVAKNYMGNIGIFLPLGIILPVLIKKINGIKVIFAGLILSLFFEITQYILCLGASDIDDLFMNTMGAAIGYCIYFIINRNTEDITKIRLKSIVVLCIIGCLGIIAVYEIYPSAIVTQENIEINKEIMKDLSEVSDISGIIKKLDTDKVYIETCKDIDVDGNEIPSETFEYRINNDTKVYCQQIEADYNAGGNATKVTSIYNEITLDKLKNSVSNSNEVSVDVWLDGDNIKAFKIIEYIS